MRQRRLQKQNQTRLQNKSRKDLIISGKSALLQLIKQYSDSFEYIVYGSNVDKRTLDIINLAKTRNVQVLNDQKLLHSLSNIEEGGFGVCGVLKHEIGRTYSFREASESFDQLDSVLCVAIPDMDYEQNIGAMIRTCAGMGVDFILIPNSQTNIFSKTITKVSMGYNHIVPIIQDNFLMVLENMKDQNFDILGMDMEGENIQNMRYNPRVCFVVGNEARGLSEPVLKKTTKKISIPMNDGVESLNVSVSLGMALYDFSLKKAIHIKSE